MTGQFWNGALAATLIIVSLGSLAMTIWINQRDGRHAHTAPIDRLSFMRMLDYPYAMIYWDGHDFERWDGKRWVRLDRVKLIRKARNPGWVK